MKITTIPLDLALDLVVHATTESGENHRWSHIDTHVITRDKWPETEPWPFGEHNIAGFELDWPSTENSGDVRDLNSDLIGVYTVKIVTVTSYELETSTQP